MRSIIHLIFSLLLVSCSVEQAKNDSKSESIDEITSTKELSETSLLSLFESISDETIRFEIDEEFEYSKFQNEKLIPLKFQDYFEAIKEFDWSEETSLLPIGKKKIGDDEVLLVVAEQYDYGTRYWGIKYNKDNDETKEHLILARTFGDAEVSESIVSVVGLKTLERTTTICIADVDWLKDPPEVLSEDCSDSTETISLKNLKLIMN